MSFPNGKWAAETGMATGHSVQRERECRRSWARSRKGIGRLHVYHFRWNAGVGDKSSLNLLLVPCLGQVS